VAGAVVAGAVRVVQHCCANQDRDGVPVASDLDSLMGPLDFVDDLMTGRRDNQPIRRLRARAQSDVFSFPINRLEQEPMPAAGEDLATRLVLSCHTWNSARAENPVAPYSTFSGKAAPAARPSTRRSSARCATAQYRCILLNS
jgi:hypothetical protein